MKYSELVNGQCAYLVAILKLHENQRAELVRNPKNPGTTVNSDG